MVHFLSHRWRSLITSPSGDQSQPRQQREVIRNYKEILETKFEEVVTSGHKTIDSDLDPNLKFYVTIGKK